MRKLLLSFAFTLLTAQTANAIVSETRADHSVKIIEMFGAEKVDAVINSSIGDFKCGEGVNLPVENDAKDEVAKRGIGRAPAIVAGKGEFALFRERVEKGEFREQFYKLGDVYEYSSQTQVPQEDGGFLGMEFTITEHDHAFNRMSAAGDKPFFHELGLTEADVKKEILKLIDNADENLQTGEDSFMVRIGEKAYGIDLKLPLLANPVYRQDVTNGNIEYGFANVLPRTKEFDFDFVSMNE